jgi:NADH-quinone oxidoreductase subunit C
MRLLRDACGFETVTFVTAIDHWPRSPRYELCVQLLSLAHGDRVRVHVRLAGDEPRVATIVDLWPGAAFSERECFDMFGIRFDGHEGLKRLLMPEEYEHFPLRKEFPHHGIEPDRLYRAWEREKSVRST